MNIELNYSITPAWELIEKVEEQTKALFDVQNEELRTSTLMVVSELLENAIKYGKSNPTIDGIQFHFVVDSQTITIEVSNSVIADTHARQFIRHIDELAECSDPMLLYTNRLKELLDGRISGESRLGLYRISHEGKFSLSYEYKDKILKVIAKRQYSE